MRATVLALGLLASSFLVTAASAQSPSTATSPPPGASASTSAPMISDQWRASKLIGLDVYNDQNEKLGDIDELLVDKTGKVDGVVIGVGGFLGVGTREIKVTMDKLQFVNEPVKTQTSSTTTSSSGGMARTASNSTTTTASSTPKKQWYPDHAIMSGASKDQLKQMPEFKYE
jgi:sporulation protein YlmC with PRC-barrel domain